LQHFLQIRLMGDDTSIQRWGSPSRQLRFASHLFVHPSFNVRTYDADLAVVRVSNPFSQTANLRPQPRAFTTPIDNLNCNLAGW
jgi:Trypsin